MARHCHLTGKGLQFGQNRSHAENKSKRRFLPNLQYTGLYSDLMGKPVRLRLSTNAIRTVEKNGGLDAYLLGTRDAALGAEGLRLKRRLQRMQATRAATAATA